MTIQLVFENGTILNQYYSRGEAPVHVPRMGEFVTWRKDGTGTPTTLQVKSVTSVIQGDFTTQPVVVVELAPPSKLRSLLR
jgi:hypothetical protein